MYPGLNMSRALGDTVAHREAGLSGIPDVTKFDIPSDTIGITLCTDGVWEFISPEFAAAQVWGVCLGFWGNGVFGEGRECILLAMLFGVGRSGMEFVG